MIPEARPGRLASFRETVAAVATAAGPAAIGCVRLTGPSAIESAGKVLARPPAGQAVRRMCLNTVRGADGRDIDEVLAVVYRGPDSYTGEDMVEIFCHGGSFNTARVMSVLADAGCRAAGPGEFTRRAFLNGKIDLAAAEAVNELVNADSEDLHRAALNQYRGGLAEYIDRTGTVLRDGLAWFEAHLEHPDDLADEDGLEAVATSLSEAAGEAGRQRRRLEADLVLRGGARVVLAGRTNAGKSSLFNRLVGRDRALVSVEAGTTRDEVSERADLDGAAVLLSDTAGFRTGAEGLDRLAAETAESAIRTADLVLFVMDGSVPASDEDRRVKDLIVSAGRKFLVLVNKCDLDRRLDPAGFAGGAGMLEVSARTGYNMEALVALARRALAGPERDAERTFCATERTVDLFRRLDTALASVRERLGTGDAWDAVVLDLRSALAAADEAAGRTAGPELLDRVFGRFCVGK